MVVDGVLQLKNAMQSTIVYFYVRVFAVFFQQVAFFLAWACPSYGSAYGATPLRSHTMLSQLYFISDRIENPLTVA
jgi:hypothetical protein